MFRVIKIISDRRIVINAGKNDVSEGDILRVIVKNDEEIIDPETNEVLGTLDFVKATVYVEHVYDKMSICRNYETTVINTFDPFEPIRKKEIEQPLNVDLSQITGGYGSNNRKIQIGDIVEKLL